MKKLFKLAVSALILVSVVACSGGTKTKDTLNIGISNTLSGLNPFNASDVASQWIMEWMYPKLLEQPSANTFESSLAKEFTTTDSKTFTIKLADAKWSDGVAITSADVAYTLNLIATPKVETTLGSYISSLEGVTSAGKLVDGATEISGVKIVDDKTLTLTTKTPVDINYLKEMIGFSVKISPKHIVETMDIYNLGQSTFATAPTVFGGAYKFIKYEQNSYVQLEANDTYFKGTPKIKNVYFKILDGTGLVTALTSGDIDMIAGGGIGVISINDFHDLKNNTALKTSSSASANAQFMYINNSVYSDVNFRLAITYAINRAKIVTDLLQGEGEVIATSYTSSSSYLDTSVEAIPYDVAKAKEYLAKSGYDVSVPIKLAVPQGNKVRMDSANLIQQDLEAIGLTVQQTTTDFATHLANTKKGDYQLSLMGLAFTVDPDETSTMATTGASFMGMWKDDYLDSLWTKGKSLTDAKERQAVYTEIQTYMRDKALLVGLYSAYTFIAQTTRLSGGLKDFWAGSLSDIEKWTLAESN